MAEKLFAVSGLASIVWMRGSFEGVAFPFLDFAVADSGEHAVDLVYMRMDMEEDAWIAKANARHESGGRVDVVTRPSKPVDKERWTFKEVLVPGYKVLWEKDKRSEADHASP